MLVSFELEGAFRCAATGDIEALDTSRRVAKPCAAQPRCNVDIVIKLSNVVIRSGWEREVTCAGVKAVGTYRRSGRRIVGVAPAARSQTLGNVVRVYCYPRSGRTEFIPGVSLRATALVQRTLRRPRPTGRGRGHESDPNQQEGMPLWVFIPTSVGTFSSS